MTTNNATLNAYLAEADTSAFRDGVPHLVPKRYLYNPNTTLDVSRIPESQLLNQPTSTTTTYQSLDDIRPDWRFAPLANQVASSGATVAAPTYIAPTLANFAVPPNPYYQKRAVVKSFIPASVNSNNTTGPNIKQELDYRAAANIRNIAINNANNGATSTYPSTTNAQLEHALQYSGPHIKAITETAQDYSLRANANIPVAINAIQASKLGSIVPIPALRNVNQDAMYAWMSIPQRNTLITGQIDRTLSFSRDSLNKKFTQQNAYIQRRQLAQMNINQLATATIAKEGGNMGFSVQNYVGPTLPTFL